MSTFSENVVSKESVTAPPAYFYTPIDVSDSHALWGANCAPTALAALLGVETREIRDAFPWFPARPWTNPTQLQEAIRRAGGEVTHVRSLATAQRVPFPEHGLAILQIDGPWCAEGVNPRAAYRYTHCVAATRAQGRLHVYDVNAGPDEQPGAWLLGLTWAREVMPLLVESTKRATGWFVKVAFEVAAAREDALR